MLRTHFFWFFSSFLRGNSFGVSMAAKQNPEITRNALTRTYQKQIQILEILNLCAVREDFGVILGSDNPHLISSQVFSVLLVNFWHHGPSNGEECFSKTSLHTVGVWEKYFFLTEHRKRHSRPSAITTFAPTGRALATTTSLFFVKIIGCEYLPLGESMTSWICAYEIRPGAASNFCGKFCESGELFCSSRHKVDVQFEVKWIKRYLNYLWTFFYFNTD